MRCRAGVAACRFQTRRVLPSPSATPPLVSTRWSTCWCCNGRSLFIRKGHFWPEVAARLLSRPSLGALARHHRPPVPIQNVCSNHEDERCEQAVENVLVGAEPVASSMPSTPPTMPPPMNAAAASGYAWRSDVRLSATLTFSCSTNPFPILTRLCAIRCAWNSPICMSG